MLHCQLLHLKNFPFEESKMVSFLPVRGVIIIQGTYSSVEELELFGKTWTSNIPRRIIAERFLSLFNKLCLGLFRLLYFQILWKLLSFLNFLGTDVPLSIFPLEESKIASFLSGQRLVVMQGALCSVEEFSVRSEGNSFIMKSSRSVEECPKRDNSLVRCRRRRRVSFVILLNDK
jgi:hypothetical protein